MIAMSSQELLTIEEAAQELRVSKWTVQNFINSGALEGVKVGTRWRVRRSAIEQYLRKRTKPAEEK